MYGSDEQIQDAAGALGAADGDESVAMKQALAQHKSAQLAQRVLQIGENALTGTIPLPVSFSFSFSES